MPHEGNGAGTVNAFHHGIILADTRQPRCLQARQQCVNIYPLRNMTPTPLTYNCDYQEGGEVKAAICALILIPYAQVSAQSVASDWFPAAIGNQWLYEHEVRDGQRNAPHIWRWQTIETITGSLTTPEGLVVLRRVDVKGDAPGGWLQTVYGESNYLLRNDCLYFLHAQIWDGQEQRLRPEFREQVLDGPEFCFPLVVGKQYGKYLPPGWVPSRVVGMGPRDGYTPESVSKAAFDVVVHLVYADETHLWFEKGVGITGMWDWHNGTYDEYRVRLVRFQPIVPTRKIP
jgi:hypothetical protein